MNLNIIIEKEKIALNYLKIYFCLIYLFILNTLKAMRKYLLKIYSKLIVLKRKKNLIKLTNLVCLIILIYNAIDMTIDFLQFDYEYKLFIDYNNDGIDLTPISVCTESDVLFDKRKVINNFDINLIYIKYENDAFNYIHRFTAKSDVFGRGKHSDRKILKNVFPDIHQDCNLDGNRKFRSFKWDEMKLYGSWKWMLNLCNNRFFQEFQRRIFDEMSFDELNALTIESNELFNCSAKVHFKTIQQLKSTILSITVSINIQSRNQLKPTKSLVFVIRFSIRITEFRYKQKIILIFQ